MTCIHLKIFYLLWNHPYSWGPMFVDCQNFAGSLGRYWFVPLQCKTIHYIVKLRGNVNPCVRVTPEIYEHRSPTHNDDATVFVLVIHHFLFFFITTAGFEDQILSDHYLLPLCLMISFATGVSPGEGFIPIFTCPKLHVSQISTCCVCLPYLI